ncbi:hypothetical protein acdb102_40810 [Acidothermaceae bacterium B102]|nr:hypothetical protein acdb102_40810 [Acidothermaceae bacterium B102]
MTRRLIWIVNHRTLLTAEVPILRGLGYEVFVPKIIPDDPGLRSLVATDVYDAGLGLPGEVLETLNAHNFYEAAWSPRLTDLINEHFEVVVSLVSSYLTPIAEAAAHFDGTLVARVFGREDPRTYTELMNGWPSPLLPAIAAMGDRFVFGQGFDNLAEVEAPELRERAHTLAVPLPDSVYEHTATWRGDGEQLVMLCPEIAASPYYQAIYDAMKADFGDLPHVIFGRQSQPVDDEAVLPYLSEAELFALYAAAPVMVYPSSEPRHVHYSPVEAMIVGTPVLYRRGALLDRLAGATLPGSCADAADMRVKAERLLAGDAALAADICGTQHAIVDTFATELAARQWASALETT